MTRERLIRLGLFAVLLVPLIFGRTLLYPFVVYRTYFFYILVDVLFAFFIMEYGFGWARVLRKNRVLCVAAVFLGVKLATDLIGLFPWVSILGNYERMMGFLTHLHLFLFFIMTVTVFRTEEAYRKLFDALTLVAGAVAFYGILNPHTGADERLFSTVGNPAFLAGFLLFGIFFGAWRGMEEKIQWRRILLLISSLLSLIALYLTSTRGALLGLAAGAVAVAAFFAFANRKARLWVGGAAMIVVVVALAVFASGGISFSDTSIVSRFSVWQSAAIGIQERPLFGYGENNIANPLDRYVRPDAVETWFDSSHNAFLDALLAHGAIGFLAFAAWLFVIMQALRGYAFLQGALVAYLVQSIFIFDTLVVLLPFYLLVGYAALRSHSPISGVPTIPTRRALRAAGIALIAILLVSTVRPIRALSAVSAGQFEEGLNLATFGHGNIASIIRDAIFREPARFQTLRPLLERAYETAREKEGELSPYFGDLAQVYLVAPKTLRKGLAPAAEQLLNRAIEISPGRPDLYFAKAQALYEAGNTDGSVVLLREVQTRFPGSAMRAQGVLDQL